MSMKNLNLDMLLHEQKLTYPGQHPWETAAAYEVRMYSGREILSQFQAMCRACRFITTTPGYYNEDIAQGIYEKYEKLKKEYIALDPDDPERESRANMAFMAIWKKAEKEVV